MEDLYFRPEPLNADEVWTIRPGQHVRFSLRFLILTAFLTLLVTLTATLGTMSSSSDFTAIVSFWPAAAFQVVFSIWFGIYGAIAGVVGPMLGNGLVGESPLMFVFGNAIQSSLAGLWFRYRRLDPRLRNRRDWLGAILVGCVLSHFLGAAVGVTEACLRSPTTYELSYWTGKFLSWLAGNTLPCVILVPALLKSISAIIVRGPLFCESFWSGTGRSRGKMLARRFSDVPIMAKLGLLIIVSGIIPLSAVAGWWVWQMVKQADVLVAQANKDAAREISNETDIHALILGYYASELERLDLTDQHKKTLLQQWSEVPGGFSSLQFMDLAEVESRMSPPIRRDFKDSPVAFYSMPDPNNPEDDLIWGATRIGSTDSMVLTGCCEWRPDLPLSAQWVGYEVVIVYDVNGTEYYRRTPPELADWKPPTDSINSTPYKIRHGGKTWHIAENSSRIQEVRYVTAMSAKAGLTAVLASIPGTLAALINLGIFGSYIAGGLIARRISERALAIADQVRQAGPEPGALKIHIAGNDEFGYLAQTLNRMSDQLEDYIQKLQETTAEKERLAAELNLAREVQMSILPQTLPEVADYEFAAICNPAREVGGDFYDLFLSTPDRAVMMIGDAAGKGLKAAMFITQTHGLARAVTLEKSTPQSVLQAVNSSMISIGHPSSEFVTMFYAELDHSSGRLLYSNAGHNPPILLRNGTINQLELGGTPLALFEDAEYELHEASLVTSDTVVMYTDGVTEALNDQWEQFGTKRLEAVIKQHSEASSKELTEHIVEAIRQFTLGVTQSDDITLLILRRTQ
ncbi:MAG: PP2C family protein-serine/threonine phosphatase [Planctomycetota bacterium]|jgi:serine phosphatase RsbU (regulator of sigma subunit)